MRPFAPNKFDLRPDFFAETIESRLRHAGEYVFHMPIGEARQPVVVNYQFNPLESSLSSDFIVGGNNPKLYGYEPHFEFSPKLYREGDSVQAAVGSQFEVRGFLYDVKKVDVNHRGYMTLEMVINDSCAVKREEFESEIEELLCSSDG